jgi:hypothetical protein
MPGAGAADQFHESDRVADPAHDPRWGVDDDAYPSLGVAGCVPIQACASLNVRALTAVHRLSTPRAVAAMVVLRLVMGASFLRRLSAAVQRTCYAGH